MKSASLNELKKELFNLSSRQLMDVCLRMVKYKKENKELLTYLLFDADDESRYVESVKLMMEELFETVPKYNTYTAVKIIRKILRTTKKYIKYSGNKQTEAELLIHFCKQLKSSGVRMRASTVISNLYETQLKNINKVIEKMHEDLQFDFQQELEAL